MVFGQMASQVTRALRRTRVILLLGGAAFVALDSPAMSDDHRLVVTRGTPSLYDWTLYDWTGFYFGGHVGYTRGNAQVTLAESDAD